MHEQLDDLELDIAEAELGELSKVLVERGAQKRATPPPTQPESAPRFTSDAVRTLFRDVARAVHPDLARDEQARDRRHALMIEANRAPMVWATRTSCAGFSNSGSGARRPSRAAMPRRRAFGWSAASRRSRSAWRCTRTTCSR